MSQLKTLTINGTKFTVVAPVPTNSVTLLASAWIGENHSYSQVVKVPDVTPYTKVDLQPTPEQLVVFYEKDLTFTTKNNGGVVTVHVIGNKPQNDYTMQITTTEVIL